MTNAENSNVAQTTHQQGIRVFASFDLVGSSALKLRTPGLDAVPEDTHWLGPLIEFFRMTPMRMRERVDEVFGKHVEDIMFTSFDIWRITGDEVIFVSGRLEHSQQVLVLARAVYSVLLQLDNYFKEQHKLGVKATIWLAGFPIRNIEFYVNSDHAPYVWTPSLTHSDDVVIRQDMKASLREFQGPEIDLGFRLSSTALPRRLVASLEVALFLAQDGTKYHAQGLAPNFHHVGWSRLKGVYGELPYPIIWLDYGGAPTKRTSFEDDLSPFSKAYFDGSAKRDAIGIMELESAYLHDTRAFRIRPYITTDQKFEPTHRAAYRRLAKKGSS